jgi:hypothetical protein
MKPAFHFIYISLLLLIFGVSSLSYIRLTEKISLLEDKINEVNEKKNLNILKKININNKIPNISINPLKSEYDIISEIKSFIKLEDKQLSDLTIIIDEYKKNKENLFKEIKNMDKDKYLNELYNISNNATEKIKKLLTTEQYEKFLQNEFDMVLGLKIPNPEKDENK